MTLRPGPAENPSIATGHLTEVVVYAGIPHAAAELVELLHEFFTSTDADARTQLGQFIADRRPDTGDPATAAAITLHELTETADVLHTLAGHSTQATDTDNELLPQPREATA